MQPHKNNNEINIIKKYYDNFSAWWEPEEGVTDYLSIGTGDGAKETPEQALVNKGGR